MKSSSQMNLVKIFDFSSLQFYILMSWSFWQSFLIIGSEFWIFYWYIPGPVTFFFALVSNGKVSYDPPHCVDLLKTLKNQSNDKFQNIIWLQKIHIEKWFKNLKIRKIYSPEIWEHFFFLIGPSISQSGELTGHLYKPIFHVFAYPFRLGLNEFF